AIDGGGDGGDVFVTTTSGDIMVAGQVVATGAAPDGDGGDVDFEAGTDIIQSGKLSAPSIGTDSCGGALTAHPGQQLTSSALMDVHGGFCGGDVSADVSTSASLGSEIDADGGTVGGTITVTAQTIAATAKLHANGLATTSDAAGGQLSFQACDLGVPAGAVLS